MLLSAKYKMKPPMSARLMPGHPLADGLAGFWPFMRKSSTQVFDLSGNGNTGTITSGSWVPGKYGSEVDFTAATTYINCGTNVGNFEYTDPFSVVIWLNPDDLASFETFISRQGSIEPYRGWRITSGMVADRTLPQFNLTHDNLNDLRINVSSTVGLVTTRLQQLVFTYDGSGAAAGVKCYIDGIRVSDTDVFDDLAGNTIVNSAPLTIGGRNSVPDYDGTFSQAIIYNRALTAEEVAQLYREPFCMFDWEWLPGRVAANGDVLVTPDPASAVAAKVDPTVVDGSITVSPSPASAVAASSGWIGISSTHLDSHCGDDGNHTWEKALDGDDYVYHGVDETHWVIVDLGQIYYVQNVRARSDYVGDPTNVNIYVNNTGEAPWGDAVASGIDTWQDTVEWVEVDITPKEGRYVYVEIVDTENPIGHLYFGSDTPFTIFDVYVSFDPTVVLGSLTISPTPASAVAATVAPTVEYGSVTIEPAEASAIAAAIDPTVESGLLNITPSPAYAIAAKVDPTVVLGSITIEPTPAAAVAVSIGPYFADEGNAIFLGANF